MSEPYVAFGNDELAKMPPVRETAVCPGCGENHQVEYGDEVLSDGTKTPSRMLGVVKCGEKMFLVAIAGQSLGNGKVASKASLDFQGRKPLDKAREEVSGPPRGQEKGFMRLIETGFRVPLKGELYLDGKGLIQRRYRAPRQLSRQAKKHRVFVEAK